MKLVFSVLALFASVAATPVVATPIVYTLSGQYYASLNFNNFNAASVLTGKGDTDDSFVLYPGVTAVTLDSFKIMLNGVTYTALQPTYFVVNPASAILGFDFDLSDYNGVSGRNTTLVGYDGSTSLPYTELAETYSFASFNTDKGLVGLRLAGQLFFTAVVTPVPEPASWVMVLVGMGIVGGRMRSRQKSTNISLA